jgi:hypothetical protein
MGIENFPIGYKTGSNTLEPSSSFFSSFWGGGIFGTLSKKTELNFIFFSNSLECDYKYFTPCWPRNKIKDF